MGMGEEEGRSLGKRAELQFGSTVGWQVGGSHRSACGAWESRHTLEERKRTEEEEGGERGRGVERGNGASPSLSLHPH